MRIAESRERIANHGEVYTPTWVVDAMLDLVKDESNRVDSRFLEPACGSGNFLVRILERKLDAVQARHKNSAFNCRNYALLALMCIYGIELLDDNVAECRRNLLEVMASRSPCADDTELLDASAHVLATNIVHGDALRMLDRHGLPIVFAEWGYLGKGKFQRRDFRFQDLNLSSKFTAADSLFGDIGRHRLFTPTRTHAPASIVDLARANQADSGSKGT